jgi:hypothetical protein
VSRLTNTNVACDPGTVAISTPFNSFLILACDAVRNGTACFASQAMIAAVAALSGPGWERKISE